MKWFANVKTLDDLKKEYRKLARQYHPDFGGNTETMQEINDEHDSLFEILKKVHNETHDEKHQTTETPEEFRNIVERLFKIPEIEVELCGSWLWISGNTKPHKDELKALGCRWSSNKVMWYWRHDENRSWHHGSASIGEIRAKYGSQVFVRGKEKVSYGKLPEKAA